MHHIISKRMLCITDTLVMRFINASDDDFTKLQKKFLAYKAKYMDINDLASSRTGRSIRYLQTPFQPIVLQTTCIDICILLMILYHWNSFRHACRIAQAAICEQLSIACWYFSDQSHSLHQWLPDSPTHWNRDKMAKVSQTTFSGMKLFKLKFHWSSIDNIPALIKPLSEPMLIHFTDAAYMRHLGKLVKQV